MRRLRSALMELSEAVPVEERRHAVQYHIQHLDLSVEHYIGDSEDKRTAMQEDRQGLGLSRNRIVKWR